jgi:hypothetical protein
MSFLSDAELVIIHAVRCPLIAGQLSKAGLTPAHFTLHRDNHLEIAWKVASEYYTQYLEPIPQMWFRNAVAKELEICVGYADILRQKLSGFMDLLYSLDEAELAPGKLMEKGLVQNLVDELVLLPQVRELANTGTGVSSVHNLTNVNQIYDQSRVVLSTREDIFDPVNRKNYAWEGPPAPTGVDWIDHAIGGIHPGSLCGLLAESAGGKTMAGVQFLVASAELRRHTLAFYYEQGLQGDIATRLFSAAAGIGRSSLNKSYDEYTQEERADLDRVTPIMSKYLHLFNMSGQVTGQGTGCVQELDTIITNCKNTGVEPKFAIIDWLGPMVMAAFDLPEHVGAKDFRDKINLTLNGLKRLTEKHNITFMILHQIAPHIIENKSPLFKPDWTVAHECKSFGLLMSYVFCFGRKDPNMCMWLNVPKARNSGNVARVVKMNPEVNRIEDVNELFSVNPTPTPGSPTFIPKSSARYDDEGI